MKTNIKEIENFFINMIQCKTRIQKYDFIYSTEFKDDSVELDELMAPMTDEELKIWFPRMCAEYFYKQYLKTL